MALLSLWHVFLPIQNGKYMFTLSVAVTVMLLLYFYNERSWNMKYAQEMQSLQDSEDDVYFWTQTLKQQISDAVADNRKFITCESLKDFHKYSEHCDNTTCRLKFDESAEERVLQLRVPYMRVSREQLDNISSIGKDVEPKRYIFLTAASSNHYHESQALVHNLNHNVFSKLHPSNFTFVYIDLGLTPLEKSRVEKNCNCTVITMPYEMFPSVSRSPICYEWKPLIIKAMLPKAEVLFYVDTSIRFKSNTNVDTIAREVRQRGVQLKQGVFTIPNHTLWPMFRFYQEMPCLFLSYVERQTGILFFHNRDFIDKIILEPWVACALNQTCMCPVDPVTVKTCHHKTKEVGECHRFEQSSLSIILVHLYGNKVDLVELNTQVPDVRRGDTMDYFRD